ETCDSRMVAICCGRNPALRGDLGFEVRRGTIPLLLAGVRLEGLPASQDVSVGVFFSGIRTGALDGPFPHTGDFARGYFGYHPQHCPRLQGDRDFPRFRELFAAVAGDAVPWGDARQAGPVASFECADVCVDYPYRNGVALVGDAAASNDPSWGQGLSIA